MEKRNISLNDSEFYKQACSYFYYHAEQRTTMINYFIAVFAGALAVYGSLIDKFPVASLLLAVFLGVVSVLFYMIDLRNKFDVKESQHVIVEYERALGLHKPEEGNSRAYGVFSNEDDVYWCYDQKERNGDPRYVRLRAFYKAAPDKSDLPEEAKELIEALCIERGVSEKVLLGSLTAAPIAHLSSCIKWLYWLCMAISVLVFVLALLVVCGVLNIG